MIIGIDGNEANVSNPVGVGRYAIEVLRHLYSLQAASSTQQGNKFVIYLKDSPSPSLPEEIDSWKYKIVGPRPLWTQIGLPIDLFLSSVKPDVFFTPSHYAARFSPCPRVISIMDLSYLFYPALFKKSDLYQLRNWTAYSVNKASHILTISEFSKNEVVKHYGISATKITVTYPGYDQDKFRINPSADGSKSRIKNVQEKYHISKRYILFVGTIQPRKNIKRLVDAFIQLNMNDVQLVLVGKKGWLYEEILNHIEKNNTSGSIRLLHYISEEDLPLLYQGAACFVLPSLYEGFGIPVIEAMACGCPAIVSHTSSLPEIVGDAAVFIDPFKTDTITRGLRQMLTHDRLKEDLREKGLEQAKKFSWDTCAKKTYDVLIEVAKSYV